MSELYITLRQIKRAKSVKAVFGEVNCALKERGQESLGGVKELEKFIDYYSNFSSTSDIETVVILKNARNRIKQVS